MPETTSDLVIPDLRGMQQAAEATQTYRDQTKYASVDRFFQTKADAEAADLSDGDVVQVANDESQPNDPVGMYRYDAGSDTLVGLGQRPSLDADRRLVQAPKGRTFAKMLEGNSASDNDPIISSAAETARADGTIVEIPIGLFQIGASDKLEEASVDLSNGSGGLVGRGRERSILSRPNEGHIVEIGSSGQLLQDLTFTHEKDVVDASGSGESGVVVSKGFGGDDPAPGTSRLTFHRVTFRDVAKLAIMAFGGSFDMRVLFSRLENIGRGGVVAGAMKHGLILGSTAIQVGDDTFSPIRASVDSRVIGNYGWEAGSARGEQGAPMKTGGQATIAALNNFRRSGRGLNLQPTNEFKSSNGGRNGLGVPRYCILSQNNITNLRDTSGQRGAMIVYRGTDNMVSGNHFVGINESSGEIEEALFFGSATGETKTKNNLFYGEVNMARDGYIRRWISEGDRFRVGAHASDSQFGSRQMTFNQEGGAGELLIRDALWQGCGMHFMGLPTEVKRVVIDGLTITKPEVNVGFPGQTYPAGEEITSIEVSDHPDSTEMDDHTKLALSAGDVLRLSRTDSGAEDVQRVTVAQDTPRGASSIPIEPFTPSTEIAQKKTNIDLDWQHPYTPSLFLVGGDGTSFDEVVARNVRVSDPALAGEIEVLQVIGSATKEGKIRVEDDRTFETTFYFASDNTSTTSPQRDCLLDIGTSGGSSIVEAWPLGAEAARCGPLYVSDEGRGKFRVEFQTAPTGEVRVGLKQTLEV